MTTQTLKPLHIALLTLCAATLACNAAGQKAYSPTQTPQGPTPHPTQAHSQPTSFTPTQPHDIEDPAFGMPYATLTIPAGWSWGGGVIHGSSCALAGLSPVFALQSPSGDYGMLSLPHLMTMATSDRSMAARNQQQGCQQSSPAGAVEFVRTMVLPHLDLQNMHITGEGPFQALETEAQQFRRQQQQFAAMSPDSQFHQHRFNVDTAQVKVAFEAHGRPMEGLVGAIVLCEQDRMVFAGGAGNQSHQCSSQELVFLYAPAGELDKLASTQIFNLKENPLWIQRLKRQGDQQLAQNAQIIDQNRNAQIQRGNDLMAAQKARYDSGMAAAHASAEATHQSAQAAAAHNGDYNDFTNTATGQTVRASNQYDNTYVNPNGTVMLQTNQAGTPGVDWSLMVPRFK